ncbi:MAG: hypothetical protein L6290_08510 [Thermodesulfovibrionales bacterium]|nr:hypothetical protein [Thermodesulfovibrionales bacterium]
MKIFKQACVFFCFVLLCGTVFAGECKTYPGSKIEEKATEEANKTLPGATTPRTTVYTSSDSFNAVVSFYRNVAREYVMPGQGKGEEKHLPSGEVLNEAYFIFDGSEDLMNSRFWAKVQRPYIGRIGAKGLETTFEDVRDVTMIITVEKQ